MKVLLTGANGQLGYDLMRLFSQQHETIGLGRQELDVTDLEAARETILQMRPDVIVHAAAYTAVDAAETDEEQAFRVNAFGSRNLAVLAEEIGAKLCYISTDYVFDGEADQPYREFDQAAPHSVYGKSKWAGEQYVQQFSRKHFIVRTSWVYGAQGNNFVKTMLRLGQQSGPLRVVHDQVGSPTYTVDLCRFLLQLIATERYGVYHASNSGSCSWFEFAQAIFEESGLKVQVEPCTTEEFPRPAPRPRYSVMDHFAIRANGLDDLRGWREALRAFIQEGVNG